MKAHRAPFRLLIAALFGALALGLSIWMFPPADAPDSPDGRFTLHGPDGRPFAERRLRGRPYALFFGYADCPDVCPTTLQKLVRARRLAGADGRLPILFVSVDPERDTPARVAAYARAFGPGVVGLTGSTAQLRHAGVAFAAEWHRDADGLIIHTATTFLVDRSGRLASTIALSDPPDDAAAEMRALLR